MRTWHWFLAALLALAAALPGEAQPYGPYTPPYPSRPPMAQPGLSRMLWVHGPGDQYSFQRQPDGTWIERSSTGAYYFQEVARTPDFVELYDPSRGASARLYATQMYAHGPGEFNWNPGYSGHWAQ